ncbi:RNA 2'-phosphotransferase [Pontibacter sp. 13R65]|uniref:RNA 2'-phosphotransferase n=1 Tax=Pontibacter sp. 13R65 TaxID=3127458 RepID=UPI00301D1023
MTASEAKKLSKFLSLVLRHQPETINLMLDDGGWADIGELIATSKTKGIELDTDKLHYLVENNDKKRFSISVDSTKIRANQGHSIQVNLGLVAQEPPEHLFHGTATQNIDSIRAKGIVKGSRHHVHLSADQETVRKVGMRYGTPIVLRVDSEQMHKNGIEFYKSENGVWLTEHVAAEYIRFEG